VTPIAVLIADDSVVVRRVLTNVLSADPDIRVVGTAGSGRIALEKIQELQPDILILDIEMPEMDGLETLRHLRRLHPRLPVIMFSTLTERAAAATLEALSLGARDYVTKPGNAVGAGATLEAVRSQLVPRIKALVLHQPQTPRLAPPALADRRRARTGPHELLVIGASIGGPDAVAAVVHALPGDLPVPVVIVQHMPPIFTRLFAQRLDRTSRLAVVEGQPGMGLTPGLVVVAPGDSHLLVADGRRGPVVATNQAPRENGCRPAVDVLFGSAAAMFGDRVLACVLTGMGQDGLGGSRRLHAAGSEIVVQDKATSVVWGMPGAVATAGLADRVVPLPRIAADLTDALRRARDEAPPGSRIDAGAAP
jgi:two-component system, chemotaxis family, protein-glutamate methylesterase/glutaminase